MVFIDELDAVGRERGLIKGSGGQERDATLNQVPLAFCTYEKLSLHLVEISGYINLECSPFFSSFLYAWMVLKAKVKSSLLLLQIDQTYWTQHLFDQGGLIGRYTSQNLV